MRKFTCGDRVRFSEVAYASRIPSRNEATHKGTVVSKNRSKNPNFIRVRRDGIKNAETYHDSFWELDQ